MIKRLEDLIYEKIESTEYIVIAWLKTTGGFIITICEYLKEMMTKNRDHLIDHTEGIE